MSETRAACTCCEEELDEQGIEDADEREGYSPCCNDRVVYFTDADRPSWVQ